MTKTTDLNQKRADDSGFMAMALSLARRGLGSVWPNPSVGCVITSGGRVVGRGWTGRGGRPHAETEALRRAGRAAAGATAYVTLEPCCHQGETGPCTEALIAARVARVVVASGDPDPRVNGEGLRQLAAAGIETATEVRAEEAADLNAGFISKVTRRRPIFTLKLATTLDGRIATHQGDSKWITGEAARAQGHRLRAEHDAVLVGSGTALRDDPELTCRLPGLEDASPVRIVVDTRLRLPLDSRLAATAGDVPTWLATGANGALAAYKDQGVTVIPTPIDEDGHCDLVWLAGALAARGLTRVLVEGGGQVAAAMIRRQLADRIIWFRAPSMIGGDGLPAIQSLGINLIGELAAFERVSVRQVGEDMMEHYKRN